MYRASSSIHIHFAHHVRGHAGPCVSIHGHTWRFEVMLEAKTLNDQGFVVDFDLLDAKVLGVCHRLLDHSLAIGERTWAETCLLWAPLGQILVESRRETVGGLGASPDVVDGELGGARNELPGGIKLAVFPFTPTSERLAEWLYRLAESTFADDRVRVKVAKIYESLHPSEAVAEFEA